MQRIFLTLIVLFIAFEAYAEPLAQTEAEIRDRLAQPATITLGEDSTFADLFATLKEWHEIQAIVDPIGAGALGVTLHSPVVRDGFLLREVPLRLILRQVLSEQDLTYVINDGFLLITSKEESQKYMKVQVYPVVDLVRNPNYKPGKKVFVPYYGSRGDTGDFDGGGQMRRTKMQVPSKGVWEDMPEYDFTELMDIIEAIVSPDSWDEGGDMIEFYPGLCLIVRQTDEVHDEIERLLDELHNSIVEQKITKTVPTKRRPLLRRR